MALHSKVESTTTDKCSARVGMRRMRECPLADVTAMPGSLRQRERTIKLAEGQGALPIAPPWRTRFKTCAIKLNASEGSLQLSRTSETEFSFWKWRRSSTREPMRWKKQRSAEQAKLEYFGCVSMRCKSVG